MRRRKLICGISVGLLISTLPVNAAAPRGISDCRASITLTDSTGVFRVFENNEPINPITSKKIDGNYKCVDINGRYDTQRVSKSISRGQILETKYAPNHFRTYMGNMAYYLDGSYSGSVEKYY